MNRDGQVDFLPQLEKQALIEETQMSALHLPEATCLALVDGGEGA
jgi:hypothetical protein